jgi:dienelactone hydrolase
MQSRRGNPTSHAPVERKDDHVHALRFVVAAALGLFMTSARAEIVTRTVDYKQGETVLEGFLAYDTAGPARKPGVLVVHDWKGIGPNTRLRTEMLAKMGYVAFAADIYGKGVRPVDGKEAGATAGPYFKNRPLVRDRVAAGFQYLASQPNVDPRRTAAIGYCFGGMSVLELARSGADVGGVVSFHGILENPTPADAKKIKGKTLILHGADDPYVPDAQVKAFADEMRATGVDWQLVAYSGAVHAFTIREAGNDNSKGAAFNATADRRSWKAMEDFFAEIFAN